jgi:hypothetical protein
VQFWCSGYRRHRLIGLDGRKPPNFVEYIGTLDTLYSKNGNIYIQGINQADNRPLQIELIHDTVLRANITCRTVFILWLG